MWLLLGNFWVKLGNFLFHHLVTLPTDHLAVPKSLLLAFLLLFDSC